MHWRGGRSGAVRTVLTYTDRHVQVPLLPSYFSSFSFPWCSVVPFSSQVLSTPDLAPFLSESLFHSFCQHKALLGRCAKPPICLVLGLHHAHPHYQVLLHICPVSPDSFSASDSNLLFTWSSIWPSSSLINPNHAGPLHFVPQLSLQMYSSLLAWATFPPHAGLFHILCAGQMLLEDALLQWLSSKPRRKKGLGTMWPLISSPVLSLWHLLLKTSSNSVTVAWKAKKQQVHRYR